MDDNKKHLITPIITFLIGLLLGSVISLFIIPDQCPVCEQNEKDLEKQVKITEQNTDSSTEQIDIIDQPIVSESEVSLPISECSINIDISGAVNNPGVYCFKEGSKIVDAIKKAEGFRKDVAYKYVSMKINLSEVIVNHQKIYIPFKEDVYCEVKNLQYVDKQESSSSQQQNENNTSDSIQTCININTSTKDQLTALNGIGESTAQKIIDARPFEKVEDILNVSGIGESTYEKFKEDICVY